MTYKDKTITIWPFEDAPQEMRDLSQHGGDEDWVAFVPVSLEDRYIPWLESGSGFGVCDVSKHPISGGTVHIGAHA
jgi:hypothetical protein